MGVTCTLESPIAMWNVSVIDAMNAMSNSLIDVDSSIASSDSESSTSTLRFAFSNKVILSDSAMLVKSSADESNIGPNALAML